MNIIFSSDDNYARHLGVAIYSLLSYNTRIQHIRIFVIDNNISSDNVSKLRLLISSFGNVELVFIPFKKWEKCLHLNMSWPISLSSYARLFVGEMLPQNIGRVLYMDCDMLVRGDISVLWETDLGDNIIGAVQDQVRASHKISIGLSSSDSYFNAGLLLIDLNRWRKNNLGEKCMRFIENHRGRVTHHDQGVLNGLLSNQWFRLPLKYNVMTIHYMVSQKKINNLFNDKAVFYSSEEIMLAKKSPIILHFTPSFTSHPWEHNCKHPLRDLYLEILAKTPWANYPLTKERNRWYVKLINWYYQMFY